MPACMHTHITHAHKLQSKAPISTHWDACAPLRHLHLVHQILLGQDIQDVNSAAIYYYDDDVTAALTTKRLM